MWKKLKPLVERTSPAQVKEKAPAPVPPPRGPRVTHPPRRQSEYRPQAVQHVEIQPEAPRRWCTYHKTSSHHTEDCFVLRNKRANRERYQRQNYYRQQYPRQQSPLKLEYRPVEPRQEAIPVPAGTSQVSEKAPSEAVTTRQEENRSNAARGNINMIAGGPTDGDSNRARKAHARRLEIHAVGCSMERAAGPEISFGPKDLEGVEIPHDDVLIIKAVIANYAIARTFIDTGSSVNIIFKKAFDQL